MPIRQITPKADVEAYLKDQLVKREKSILKTLNFVGITCINEARTNGNYIDQTGNLRSSIGYAILQDGMIVHKSRFEQVKDGKEGKGEGSGFLSDLISRNMKGIVLIVVAGMNYAAHVETSKNVITSAELLAQDLVPKLLRQLGFQIR